MLHKASDLYSLERRKQLRMDVGFITSLQVNLKEIHHSDLGLDGITVLTGS
jgi:hypothetical protein